MENNNDYAKYWYDERERCEQLSKQLYQLKAENEQLKNFHINLVGVKECDIRELVKLKQILTEIKEIAEENKDTIQYKGICLSILQKISEVEDD